MNKRKSLWRLLTVFLVVAWIPTAVHGKDKPPILIGATISLEGKYKEQSSMIHNSYILWSKDINKRGGLLGREVKLILYDDKSQGPRCVKLYEELIEKDGVDLLLSPYGTPLTLVASEVSEKHKKVMLASAASGEIIWNRGYRYVLGVYALAKRYFIGFLDLIAREGLDTLAVIHEKSPFHTDTVVGIEEWSKRFGVDISFKAQFMDASSQLPGLIKEAQKSNAEALIVSAYSPECHMALGVMNKMSYRPRALAMSIAPVHPDFYQKAGPIAEGIFGPSQLEPDERIPFPGTVQFIKDFVAHTGVVPSYHAGSAYAACQILENAVEQTRSIDNDNIRDYIFSMDTVTVIGRFKVDADGKQIGHNPILIQWQNRKKEIVYPIKMKTAPAIF